ncbi:hypothetical protein D9M71_832850 [compost metagenome]
MRTDHCPELHRHGVAYLTSDRCLRPDEEEVVAEPLDPRRLVMGDRSMLGRVKVAPLLGLEELRTDRDGRLLPHESTHDIARSRMMPLPAVRLEVFW